MSSMLNQFCLRIGTELVPETLYSNELTQLCAREDYIESCRRESFKTYNTFLGGTHSLHCLHRWVQVLTVKVKVKFTLEQAMKAQRGSRGIALLFP
jgi:hypothetical protein